MKLRAEGQTGLPVDGDAGVSGDPRVNDDSGMKGGRRPFLSLATAAGAALAAHRALPQLGRRQQEVFQANAKRVFNLA